MGVSYSVIMCGHTRVLHKLRSRVTGFLCNPFVTDLKCIELPVNSRSDQHLGVYEMYIEYPSACQTLSLFFL